MMDWQPIETAPKDGSEILLYREDCGVILGRWIACCEFVSNGDPSNQFCDAGDDDGWEEPDWFGADFIDGYRISNDGVPTHWMPLPSPPEKIESGANAAADNSALASRSHEEAATEGKCNVTE